jgi:hypothetical protein
VIGSWVSGFAAWCRRLAADRGALAWAVVVATGYVGATLVLAQASPPRVNPAMQVALALSHGRLSLNLPAGTNDTATVGGLTYQVISPLPILPYLALVPFPALWAGSRWISGCAMGVVAGWLCLPFARRYAGPGQAAYWLAALGAFGTLLFDQAVQGDFYYLAQVQAMLFSLVALIEWRAGRRPWLLGAAFGLAALARPTVLLAAIPFGLALVLPAGRRKARTSLGYLAPIGLAVGLTAIYDAARFGSPIETGYGISALGNPVLAEARAAGLFSVRHLGDNLRLLLVQGFGLRDRFPFLVPDPYGQSILLTSPALLISLGAGLRRAEAALMWAAAALVTIPLLLYYGGGGWLTYGFRYFLDAVPFLLALVGMALRRHFGRLEQALIVLSVVFVSYGLVWALFQ